MLVNRWGLLRRAISKSIHIRKVPSLVVCLCRLHNFCITERVNRVKPKAGAKLRSDIRPSTAADNAEITANGGIPLVAVTGNETSPEQLLHGGSHFDDVPSSLRRSIVYRARRNAIDGKLPQDLMLESVQRQGLVRPTPKKWKQL